MKNIEDLVEYLESLANFMRGMCFDPRLHNDIKESIREKLEEVDNITNSYNDQDI